MIVPPHPPPPPPPMPTTEQHKLQKQQANPRQQTDIDETISGPETEAAARPPKAVGDDNSCYLADDDATVDLGKAPAATEHQEVAQLKAQATTKRRSSWRHLLSPSYKSRSDEFHKFFASEIPKGERLIADYSCALHRDLLIQGRLYVSVNYLAFYSNLFGWVTKLVVRLRAIRDIHKANTAKFIPNAIQILTHSDEKHVFASFIARDKSFLLIWRIWRNNNQLKERLSDQEIRKLVHLSYGKDLGLNDLEESKISAQPLPRTPANFIDELRHDQHNQQQVIVLDRNNNTAAGAPGKQRGGSATAKRSRFKSRSQNQKELMLLMSPSDDTTQLNRRGHARYSSLDCGRVQTSLMPAPGAGQQQAVDLMLNELSDKLAELSSTTATATTTTTTGPHETTCSPASSAVVVDTPASLRGRRSRESHGSPEVVAAAAAAGEDNHVELVGEQIFASGAQPDLAEAQYQQQQQQVGPSATEGTTRSEQSSSTGTVKCDTESRDNQQVVSGSIIATGRLQQSDPVANLIENLSSSTRNVDVQQHQKQQHGDDLMVGPPLNTSCGCNTHEGELIVDEELDINVDILFSLIFTNSRFMRAHMLQRGQEDLVVGKWRRPAAASQSDRSNSSTLSSRGGGGGGGAESGGDYQRGRRGSTTSSSHHHQHRQHKHQHHDCKNFKTKQVRQLNYSMNVNHVLAKQVQVEEKQNICQVRPGVYVLESQAINSGFPCSESFTIDLKYCLTRTSHLNKSRLRVHGQINFLKEKHNWRLAMVKPIIEKQSMQGIVDCIRDLIVSIQKHIELKKQQGDPTVYLGVCADDATTKAIFAQSSADQPPPPPLAHQQTSKHHNHQHSRSSLARAKSKLKERKLRNMYKYYIHNRSHRADDDDSGEGLRSPGGAASGPLVSSGSSSSMSSLCASGLNDDIDDESMIMMFASGGPPRASLRQGNMSINNHRRRHQSNLIGATDDDDDDEGETGDELEDNIRATNHLLVGRRSFSDLEDGPTQHSDQDQDEWPRRRRRLESETSNATLNNEQPARAPHRLFGGWIGGGGARQVLQRRRSSAQSTAAVTVGHNHQAPHKQARQARAERTKSSATANTTHLFPTSENRATDEQQQVAGPVGRRRLLARQNLLSLLLVCLVVLVLIMLMLHLVILRRLGHVEQLLVANCNSSQPPPPRSPIY